MLTQSGTTIIARRAPTQNSSAAFTYFRNPLCWLSLLLYLANRFLIKPSAIGQFWFFRDYFNDLLCIPLWLPPLLWLHRKLRLRTHDAPPTPFELIYHWIIWSICFEAIGPRLPPLRGLAIADPYDAVAYAVGMFIAGMCWGSWSIRRRSSDLLFVGVRDVN